MTGSCTLLETSRADLGPFPEAAGLLVSGGRIAAVLTDEQVRREAALGGTIVELPGRVAIPGLVDAHAHLLGYGLAARRADLVGAETVEETLERAADHGEAHPDDPWVLGRGWDQNDWPDETWPDADRRRGADGHEVRPHPAARHNCSEIGLRHSCFTPHGQEERRLFSGATCGSRSSNWHMRSTPGTSCRSMSCAVFSAARVLLIHNSIMSASPRRKKKTT